MITRGAFELEGQCPICKMRAIESKADCYERSNQRFLVHRECQGIIKLINYSSPLNQYFLVRNEELEE